MLIASCPLVFCSLLSPLRTYVSPQFQRFRYLYPHLPLIYESYIIYELTTEGRITSHSLIYRHRLECTSDVMLNLDQLIRERSVSQSV